MPRKKPIQKKPEEDFIMPFGPDALKHSIEVPVKTISQEDIVKVEKIKQEAKPKRKKKTEAEKISLKETKIRSKEIITGKREKGEYILIITEKPQAALKIASALGNARKYSDNSVPYYELEREGKKIIVACAVGHLFTLSQKEKGSNYPRFDIEWKPNFEVKKQDFTRKYYVTLAKLARKAKSFIVATDYDIEGEVIGWNVVRFIAGEANAKRMKFSSLTAKELQDAYTNAQKELDWGQAYAGETRHFLDWMYGINLSRALMTAIKTTGKFRIMSIGRVQGPALALVVNKERQIMSFKPQPYWDISLIIKNSHEIEVKYPKDITKESELEKFKRLKGKKGEAKTEKTQQNILPPAPFDLTTLQIEAYKFFGISPARTLQIAQQLYLEGLISYPRTASQKIPDTINPKSILKKLSSNFDFVEKAVRNTPTEGKKSDPAHPSIYQTGEYDVLEGEKEKIYSLIVRRFVSCFCEDAIVENKVISVNVDDLRFTARGLEIKEKGWMEVYLAKMNEKELPDVNGQVIVKEVKIEKKMTQPPKRYSPASIISELEKRNLGTKATRSAIVETLYSRGYIEGESIKATTIGIKLIETLEKYSPIIIDEKLTRNFEKEMDGIVTAKHNLKEKEQKVIDEAKEALTKISNDFRKKEKNIGKELVGAQDELYAQKRKDNEIVECPVCKKGKLSIMYSKKTRRFFVACNAYPECKTAFSLPPNGSIKKTDKICEKCNFPMLMRLSKGKRPWIFCFNPACETNKQWVDKRREAQEEKESEEEK